MVVVKTAVTLIPVVVLVEVVMVVRRPQVLDLLAQQIQAVVVAARDILLELVEQEGLEW